jgi:hypothetical protein
VKASCGPDGVPATGTETTGGDEATTETTDRGRGRTTIEYRTLLGGDAELVAVIVTVVVPGVVGVPEIVPVVPLKVRPVGSVPVREKVGFGLPVAVTV